MAFTDRSDLFGSVHEDGIDLVVRHLMRQRPSLFNYATPTFHARPELFCQRIDAAPSVLDAGNPTFTEQAPLPILGAPVPLGVDFCLQFTDAQVDFHPGNVFELPPELRPLQAQHFALRARACAGISCPPQDVIDELLPAIERFLVAQQIASGDLKEGRALEAGRAVAGTQAGTRAGAAPAVAAAAARLADVGRIKPPGVLELPPRGVFVLPTRELECVCLEVFAVGHVAWGPVAGSTQPWLKAAVDGVEIVDLRPEKLENALECYAMTVLKLGILPRVMVPMETMILDVTEVLRKQGLQLGKQVTLEPSAVPADVPNNPAIEDDQVKAFIELSVTDVAP